MPEKHWFESILESPFLWGILAVVALAFGFSPRESRVATWVFLGFAVLTLAAMVWFHERVRAHPGRVVFTLAATIAGSSCVLFFGLWLTHPKVGTHPSDAPATSSTDAKVEPPGPTTEGGSSATVAVHVTRAPSTNSDAKSGERSRPKINISLVLGADKGIGKDALINCRKPPYKCLSENEIGQLKNLSFDVGAKGWARLVLRFENVGNARLVEPHIHFESPDPISIENAANPNPYRMPRNVLEIADGRPMEPTSIAEGAYVVPLDITVPSSVTEFSCDAKIFGSNMRARKLQLHFIVYR